jgi:flagellar FliJ protein
MSRARAKRIAPIVQIAKNAVQESLSFMGEMQQRLDSEIEKTNTLEQYQLEYQNNFSNKGHGGVTGLEIQHFESFMLQISGALVNQAQQVRQIQDQLKQAQDIYKKLNQKLKSYEKLESRLNDQALASENQQIQKFLDELGSQLHRRHSS